MRLMIFGWVLAGLVVLMVGCADQGYRWVNDGGAYCYTRDFACSAHTPDPSAGLKLLRAK